MAETKEEMNFEEKETVVKSMFNSDDRQLQAMMKLNYMTIANVIRCEDQITTD